MVALNVVRSSFCVSLVALFVFAALGCTRPHSPPQPNSALPVLVGADQFTVYALEPDALVEGSSAAGFHGNVILGQAEIRDAGTRAKISDIVNQGVRMGGARARCFSPRHGIHMTQAGRTVDLVICYQCSTIHVIDNGNMTLLDTGNVQQELDAAFQSAGASRSR